MKRLDLAMLASALYAGVGDIGNCYTLNPKYRQPSMPKPKTTELCEFSWKGRKIMAYSKADARNRIKAQLAKGE